MLVDVTPSQEMVDEGIAREVVNKIQKLSKKVGLVGVRGSDVGRGDGREERREGRRAGWRGGGGGGGGGGERSDGGRGRREGWHNFVMVSSTGWAAATRSSGGGV